jgi:hypothetical protein
VGRGFARRAPHIVVGLSGAAAQAATTDDGAAAAAGRRTERTHDGGWLLNLRGVGDLMAVLAEGFGSDPWSGRPPIHAKSGRSQQAGLSAPTVRLKAWSTIVGPMSRRY